MNAPVSAMGRFDALPRFASPLKAIESLKPSEPLYLVHPEKFAAAAKQFLDGFPGDVLYAVKANPHPVALDAAVECRHPPFRQRQPGRDRSGQVAAARRHLPLHGAGASAGPGQGGVREAWRHRFRGRQRIRTGKAAGRNRQARQAARLRAAGRIAGRRAAGNVQQVWLPARGSRQACSSAWRRPARSPA